MPDPADTSSAIEFSIVTAVYNVARYLPEFIDSIESQKFNRERFEVIAVDDGSTDDSLAILRAWEARRPGLVRVITKENGGQSTARNLGMERVRGAWVTFTDPDDLVEENYLSEIARFVAEHPETQYVAARLFIYDEATGARLDSHPLRRNFWHGNRLRDLVHYPDHFHGHAASAFFRVAAVRATGLRFDPAIRPNFEDVHFCCRYLLHLSRPAIGFVASTGYLYRRRQDQTSTQQSSEQHSGRYTTVLREGMLDLLRTATTSAGREDAPEWLQQLIIYQLSWYFSAEDAQSGAFTHVVKPVAEEFHALLGQIVRYLNPDVIAGYAVRPLRPAWVDILIHGYRDEPWHQDFVLVSRLDAQQELVRISYRYSGTPPEECVLSGGEPIIPKYAKTREIGYHGRVLLQERILWTSSRRSVRVQLNGRNVELRYSERRPQFTLRPGQIKSRLDPAVRRTAKRVRVGVKDRIARRIARTRIVRRLFRNAWVLMDRITDAQDSAEQLFRFIHTHRRDINAWFVLEAGSQDWRRLRSEFGHRVIPHGSIRWKLMMLNCRHLISTHADVPIMQPSKMAPFGRPSWQFTFLQHGVIQSDLSRWLNNKVIDLFVTSTPSEHKSIAGELTPYVFTTKEVKLTGLPRFDRLLDMSRKVPTDQRNVVLVAPTWRSRLAPIVRSGSHQRAISPAFLESEFAKNWLTLLRSSELAALCQAYGLTLGFLPHPNFQRALPSMELPDHVAAFTFAQNDVQDLFARTAVMITDYSSVAFDVAYIDRPIVYFQFDHDQVLGGEHIGRHGYFDYERDGFGPVVTTVAAAVEEVREIVARGSEVSEGYRKRIASSFPLRDGKCCERVLSEILLLSRRNSAVDDASRETGLPLARR